MQSKTTISIIVIVVAILGIWWFMGRGKQVAAPVNNTPAATTETSSASQSQSETAAVEQPAATASNSTDEAITGDTAAIDAQLNNLNSDSASADASLKAQ